MLCAFSMLSDVLEIIVGNYMSHILPAQFKYITRKVKRGWHISLTIIIFLSELTTVYYYVYFILFTQKLRLRPLYKPNTLV